MFEWKTLAVNGWHPGLGWGVGSVCLLIAPGLLHLNCAASRCDASASSFSAVFLHEIKKTGEAQIL